MDLKLGDVLVFVGNERLRNKHYDDNFELGKRYKISRLEKIGYDIDEVSGYNSDCVLFENHPYGCLISSLMDYFMHIDEYRDKKINTII